MHLTCTFLRNSSSLKKKLLFYMCQLRALHVVIKRQLFYIYENVTDETTDLDCQHVDVWTQWLRLIEFIWFLCGWIALNLVVYQWHYRTNAVSYRYSEVHWTTTARKISTLQTTYDCMSVEYRNFKAYLLTVTVCDITLANISTILNVVAVPLSLLLQES